MSLIISLKIVAEKSAAPSTSHDIGKELKLIVNKNKKFQLLQAFISS